VQIKIKILNVSISTRATSFFKHPNVPKHLSYLHDKSLSLQTKFLTISFMCVNHII